MISQLSSKMGQPSTIYADYQATTPVDSRVVEKMAPYWSLAFGNPHSSDHIVGWRAADAVSRAAESVAWLIGADPDEVVFTSGATEANNLALLGLARRDLGARRTVLVSAIEHKCVLSAAQALEDRDGFTVEMIPVDDRGFVDLDYLESQLDKSVLAVSIMAVNNEIGTIQDIPAVSELVSSVGALFHCDAAQAPCAMAVGELASYADLVSLSGHKIYGPQGIGALYLRRDVQDRIEPIIYGGGQQGGLRSGTVPLALCVGMAAAAEIVDSNDFHRERIRIAQQRDRFVGLVRDGSFPVVINGPVGDNRHPGNANLRFDGFSAEEILGTLQPRLAASSGAACTTGIPEPSHVLQAIGLSQEQAEASVRFSFGRFTTDDEIDDAANLLIGALESLSRI